MEMKLFVFYFAYITSLLVSRRVECNRFAREELGVADRLRFTSGKYEYYKCEIINKRLISNLKIGIYVYNHKSSIKFQINDTNYRVETVKLENFFSAVVTARSEVNLNSNQNIKVTAHDQDDVFIDETILKIASSINKITAAPTFLNASSTSITVDDNVSIGSSIGKLYVDNQLVPVTFYLNSADLKRVKEFTISVDGRLILTKQLDYKQKKEFDFSVFARYVESPKASSINIKIKVKPAPKTTPVIPFGSLRHLYKSLVDGKAVVTHPKSIHKVLTFSFSELSPPSTIIGSVGENGIDFLYAIITGNDGNIFAVDSNTGVISIAATSRIDYETRTSYLLSVTGTNQALTAGTPSHVTLTADVTLNVLDANDNSPLFTKNRYTVNVAEDASLGSRVTQLTANDKDSGNNGKVSFVLDNTDKVPFQVTLDGWIIVTEPLDIIQNSDRYILFVKAIDSGWPFRRESEVTIEVNVEKINSYKPVLRTYQCDVNVPTDSKKSVIFKLQAVDKDVYDALEFRQVNTDNVLFTLNAISGELSLTSDLNGEKRSSESLELFVYDGKHKSEVANIVVHFIDGKDSVTDNCNINKEFSTVAKLIKLRDTKGPSDRLSVTPKPLVPLRFIKTPPKSLQLSEASSTNLILGVFNALNPNLQSYGLSLYSITKGNIDSKFQIDVLNGTLFLRDRLDREQRTNYQLQIEASGISGEQPARYSLEIIVEDVNDNVPKFANDRYEISISEHKNIGYVLVKVEAIDKDSVLSQRNLQYSLVSSSSIFQMNTVTGELSLKSLLSEQPFKEYFLQVQAADQSPGQQLNGYTWVHINILEFSNHPPACLSDEQKIEVATNTPLGVTIGRVFAYDVNQGEAGVLAYKIKSKNNIYFDDYFSLNSKTGLIQLKKQLSQQDKGVIFKIKVEVRDNGIPSLSTTCHVYKIIVDGFGLSQPSFVDETSPIEALISDNAGRGAAVTQMKAILPGNETSQNIRYELVDGNGIGTFTIDKLLGTIYVADSSFTSPFYWLTVQAYLASSPSRYRNAHILIRIQYKKERQPYFSPSVYHVSVKYSRQYERDITQLYATDGNRRFNVKGLQYAIYAGNPNGLFKVQQNGLLKSDGVLDVGQYRLNVTVGSSSNSSLISHGYVVVNVKNLNSDPPTFELTFAPIKIYEKLKSRVGAPYLFQALARNPNSDEMLKYKINLQDGGNFTINPYTGVINIEGDLIVGKSYIVSVQATNVYGKDASAMFTIEVSGIPKKSTKLSFRRKSYFADVKENVAVGYVVIDFTGEITTTGNEVFFYILSGNDQQNFYFSPIASKSFLKVWKPLDFEQQAEHKIEILAFDGQSMATTSITITVDNVNDNSLTSSQACFEARIPENEQDLDSLITVQVSDPDKALPGFKYSLVNDAKGTSPFNVNNNGVVRVKPGRKFDRETKDEYVITVVGGLSQENATYCVNVFIEDANDHQPNFTQSVYKVRVVDSTPVGTYFMAAYATDKDIGSNARLDYLLEEENRYFGINTQSGILFVKSELREIANTTVVLNTKAVDHGSPGKYGRTQIEVHVDSDLRRLQFDSSTYHFNISENLPPKTLVSDRVKLNMSQVHYELITLKDNVDCAKKFRVDPFTGILLTAGFLDAEQYRNCSFKVNGVLFNDVVTMADIFINIIDVNDNRPLFTNATYTGFVSESQNSNTKVKTFSNEVLVTTATDEDSSSNGDILYSFVEKTIGIYFNIDVFTGEIATNAVLDCEKHQSKFEFHVKASDRGRPMSFASIVPVTIHVININDRIPEFVDMQVLTLSLPAYNGMIVHRLSAIDYDVIPQPLTFRLIDESGVFDIKSSTGDIYVEDASRLRNQRVLMAQVTVSDSDFFSVLVVQIKLTKYVEHETFRFIPKTSHAGVVENENVTKEIVVVNPVGYETGEQLRFRMLNPQPEFEIGKISGIVKISPGVVFDREKKAFYALHIEAWKLSNPEMVARTLVNVTVQDVNDNPPMFEQKKFYKAIDIDNDVGTPLLSVTATDADVGKNARISYQIISGDGMAYFNCQPDTGVITLKKKFIKSQAKPKYTLKIRASDSGALQDVASIEMHLINKDQPMFAGNYIESIPEDTPQGQSIVKITARGRNNRQVYYHIVDGDEYEVFHVGFTNGELAVAGELDYSKERLYSLKVRAIDSLTGSWSDTNCDVNILDVNDNYPMFDKPFYSVSILEDARSGSDILTISASDKDSGRNADIVYNLSFVSDDSLGLFRVDETTGVISLSAALDAEKKTSHFLQVKASDNGNPPKSSSAYITVHVVDVNDNKPEFLESGYDFTFESYKKELQFIGEVQAFDADANDVLLFSVEPKSTYISVDRTYGTVYLKAGPSSNEVVQASVVVSDGKNKVTVPVVIRWKVGNEHKPRLPSDIVAYVNENDSPEVKFVTKLRAKDDDKGADYGKVKYQIDCDDFKELFTIDDEGNIYSTKVIFDHEAVSEYNLPVRATDGGGLFALSQVRVVVKDENDNAPIFEFSNYEAHVKTSQYSAVLVEAFAHDKDGGINSELKYVAHGLGSETPLLVDNKTGIISLAGTPRGHKYQFSIQVSDNGYPVQQSRADITILVKGWNENILTFTNSTYMVRVREDITPTNSLLRVNATMKDYHGGTSYRFVQGNLRHTKSDGLFEIDQLTGQITLVGKLDYETTPLHKLMVVAETETGDATNCFVVVHVINVNDNSPRFVTESYSISISESTPRGTELIRISAKDLDDPYGGSLSYSFSSRSPYFAIDKKTGWVRIKQPLDREKQDNYNLVVRVRDERRNMVKTMLSISIVDVNDTPPKFEEPEYTFVLTEDAIVRQVIGTLKAVDKDLNSTIQYFYKSPSQSTKTSVNAKYNRQFSIDHNSGTISLLKPIKAGLSAFTVVAYDGLHVTSTRVTIRVTDVNDNSPMCLNSFYDKRIREDWDLEKEIIRIKARDEDTSDLLRYDVQGNGIGKFRIDRKTGMLRATEKLDYETQSRHNFKVVVSDNAGHKCGSDIFIQLLDVNDNKPTFDQRLYVATVHENTSHAVIVTQVRATDRDTYNKRKISYSILQNNTDNAFAIGERGIVTVNKPSVINRKIIPKYSLLIQAKDHGEERLSSTTELHIIVLSNTDTPPQFDKLGYTFNITENNMKDAKLGKIIVTSTKNLKDKKITVTIMNDASNNFFIDESGYLIVRSRLDFETQSRYSFDIKAYYEFIPSLSSTVNVEIQVNDDNDHAPQFSQQFFQEKVDENVRPGKLVLQAFATDKDGSNKNSVIMYSIEGEENQPFVIGPQTGWITVNGSVDHEMKSSYSFDIVATDNGLPPRKTKVKAVVNVTDLNDNPPAISNYNATVIVQEGKPPGSTLLSLTIKDVDSEKNGAPFGCSLLDGDAKYFDVVAGDKDTCVIKSKQEFQIVMHKNFVLKLRVTDSGTPTQFSDSEVKVLVVEESFHPPVIQDPKIFFVIVARPYGVTKIGNVNVFDKDDKDLHQFKITAGNLNNFFSIQSMTGVIEGRPTEGSYSLTLGVTDGKFTDSGVFKVVVNEFNEKLKVKSVAFTVHGAELKTFMESKMVQFVSLLAEISGTTSEKIFVWSIQEAKSVVGRKKREATDAQSKKTLLVAVGVRRIDSLDYVEPSVLKGYVENSAKKFGTIGLVIDVGGTECVKTTCPEKQKCVVTFTPTNEIVSLYVPTGYMGNNQEEKCYCPDGAEGPVCNNMNPCSHNPCKIGERCVVTSTYFKCECNEPNKCNLTVDTVTLTGDSFISYQLRKPFDVLFNSLSVEFRTETKSNNILFYAATKDYFILEIERGNIQARFDFGSGVGSLLIEGRQVNDGNWHHVHIERYGKYVAMTLDEKSDLKKEGLAPGNSAKININGHVIVFGAGISNDGKPFNGFKGCMRAPNLNKKLLPFSGTNDLISLVDVKNVKSDCKDSGRCSSDRCPRFSDCINTLSSFKCVCLEGHYGDECHSKLTCADNPCKNGGLCTYEEISNIVSYKCTCKQGFTGGQCQIALGPCASKPCLNNGKCIIVNENSYTCQCMVGFYGVRCAINENPCASNPCRHSGTCRNLYNDFRCDCPPGKYGRRCSANEYCLSNPCLNGGSCIELRDGFKCKCTNKYYGIDCANDVDECLSGGACGSNTCINTIGDYYCNCTGSGPSKSCVIVVPKKSEEPIPLPLVVGAGVGVLLLILIIAVVLCCFWKRRKRDYTEAVLTESEPHTKYPLNRYPRDDEFETFLPPSPPPRGEILPPGYYDETDQASAAMYDPSMVTFSSVHSSADECAKKVPFKFSPAQTSLEYNTDEEDMKSQPGCYHWDYSEVPEDIIIKKMSREGSRIQLTKADQYFEDDADLQYVEMPEVPERPASRRSSLPGYTDSELDRPERPELPELPQHVRLSRQSLRSGNQSPSNPNGPDPISSSDFLHRYSLLSDESDVPGSSYLHDDIEAETMSELTRVTRPDVPYHPGSPRSRYESESSNEDDGYTETSFNSGDNTRPTNYDPDNPRDLERHIQRLFKDLQKRTEEDLSKE